MTRSLAYFTDLALRRQEGSLVARGPAYAVVRSPANPTFWWGNFLLMPALPAPGDRPGWEAAFTQEYPHAAHRVFGVDVPGPALEGPAADEFRAAGYDVRADTVLGMGVVANEVAECARTCDLVVIGHRGVNNKFSTGLLGSTAESVTRK